MGQRDQHRRTPGGSGTPRSGVSLPDRGRTCRLSATAADGLVCDNTVPVSGTSLASIKGRGFCCCNGGSRSGLTLSTRPCRLDRPPDRRAATSRRSDGRSFERHHLVASLWYLDSFLDYFQFFCLVSKYFSLSRFFL